MSTNNPAGPAITLDAVRHFLETDPDGLRWLQSVTDSKVTQGIETWRKNNLDQLVNQRVEAELKTRYPEETAEQKRIRELEERVRKAEDARAKEALRNRVLSEFQQRKLPVDLADFFVREDEQGTLAAVEKLASVYQADLEGRVNEKLGTGGRTPASGNPAPTGGTYTREQLSRMTPAELNAEFESGKLAKALAEGKVKP